MLTSPTDRSRSSICYQRSYISPEQTQNVLRVSTAKSASYASSATTPFATDWRNRHGHYMNILHDFYDNNSLDFCIVRDNIMYQVVGRSDRTQPKRAARKRSSLCTLMDRPPYGERL